MAVQPTMDELQQRLVDELVATGDLRSPAWAQVFAAVPRHLFVPTF